MQSQSVLFFNLIFIEKASTNQDSVCRAMVHNPIYAGPVYECIPPQPDDFALTVEAATDSLTENQTYECQFSSTSQQNSSEDANRYVNEPCSPQNCEFVHAIIIITILQIY